MINENKFHSLWNMSKYVYGIVPVIIGIDKYTFLIVDWTQFVSPFVASLIPVPYLIPLLGIIEISTGVIILTKWPKLGAYMAAGLIGLVIINLILLGGYYDIILRDTAIAYGYIVFAKLTELKESAQQSEL